MQNSEENKLKPEESSSGFSPSDYEGNIFGGSRKTGDFSGLNNEAGFAQTSSQPHEKKRIVIDSNTGTGGGYKPPKKSHFWKWFFSIFFILALMIAGSIYLLVNFVTSPGFLKGDKENQIKKQTSVEVITDDRNGNMDVDISPDLGFDTDSLVNTILAKAKDSKTYTEIIDKRMGDKTYHLKVEKSGNLVTIETFFSPVDEEEPWKFVRRIAISVDSPSKNEAKVNNSSDNVQKEVEKRVVEKVEKKIYEKPIVRTPESGNNNESKVIVKKEPKKEIEKDISPKAVETPEPDKNAKYTFEKKFGKRNQMNENLAKSEVKPTPDVPSQEKQYASESPIYTIQVYSTPNIEDAKFWVSRLQQLNISTAYISKQKIRDIMWYRVRFGEYPTKEEAKSAASKFGFSQLWIDRVK
jgi:hypothetical protein